MKTPLKAAAWLTPSAIPRWLSGKTSVRMAAELAMSMAAPTPWKIRITISQHAGGVARHPGDAQHQREEREDGEAQVVDPHPAVDVAQPAEAHHQHAGDHQEAEDHPQQEEGVAGLERVDPDPPEDVGQRDEHDRAVDGGHQHPEGRDEQGHPLVVGRQAVDATGQPGVPTARPVPAGTGRRDGRLPTVADSSMTAMAAPAGHGRGPTPPAVGRRPAGLEVNAPVGTSCIGARLRPSRRRPRARAGRWPTGGRSAGCVSSWIMIPDASPMPPARRGRRGAWRSLPGGAAARIRPAGRVRLLAPRHDLHRPGSASVVVHGGSVDRRRPCPSTARWPWPSRWWPASTRPTAGPPIKSQYRMEPDHPARPGTHLAGRESHVLHRRRAHPARPDRLDLRAGEHRAPLRPGPDGHHADTRCRRRRPAPSTDRAADRRHRARARPSPRRGPTTLAVYPPNDPDPPIAGAPAPGTEGIFATYATTGTNAGVDLVCPFFTIPSWQSQSAGCSTTKPAGETTNVLTPDVTAGDRPGRRGREPGRHRAARGRHRGGALPPDPLGHLLRLARSPWPPSRAPSPTPSLCPTILSDFEVREFPVPAAG